LNSYKITMNAIVVGATSGIGRELVRQLCKKGYTVGATGRRIDYLNSLKKEIGDSVVIKEMDVSKPEFATNNLTELISDLGSVDLIIISAGLLLWNSELDLEKDLDMIAVNVIGFTAIANFSINYFIKQKKGHLVGISSISALRGSGKSPSYPASKAYMSNYLQGLRKKVFKSKMPITITDIKPGYVKTEMVGDKDSFWMATVEEASEQIINIISKKSSNAYVTKKWRLMAWLMKYLPDFIYNRL
jgi:short-subunit dehydrogenase